MNKKAANAAFFIVISFRIQVNQSSQSTLCQSAGITFSLQNPNGTMHQPLQVVYVAKTRKVIPFFAKMSVFPMAHNLTIGGWLLASGFWQSHPKDVIAGAAPQSPSKGLMLPKANSQCPKANPES